METSNLPSGVILDKVKGIKVYNMKYNAKDSNFYSCPGAQGNPGKERCGVMAGSRGRPPFVPPAQRRVLIGGSFAELCVARDLKDHLLVAIADDKECLGYTLGVLRAHVMTRNLDALTFTLCPVTEGRIGCKLIWGAVTEPNGQEWPAWQFFWFWQAVYRVGGILLQVPAT